MKRAVTISFVTITLLIIIAIASMLCGESIKQKFTTIFKNDYKYGVLYSYHDCDAVIQYYSEEGILLSEDIVPNVRACGVCSSTGKPMQKLDGNYYFVSDASFDNTIDNCILKIEPSEFTYETIGFDMEINYTYVFTIDDQNNKVYAYYSGAPEWGSVYCSTMDGKSLDSYSFSDLEGYSEYLSPTEHFWPLDMECFDDTCYFVGYIVNSSNRILCLSSVQNNHFDVICTLDGYLFGKGMLGIDNNIFISTYDDFNETVVHKYSISDNSLEKHIVLPYFSNNVDILSYNDNLVLLDCNSSDNISEKKILYIGKNLEIAEEYTIFHNMRLYDFQKDCIICSDGYSFYVYDLNWNEINSFALNGVMGMKFSGIFMR